MADLNFNHWSLNPNFIKNALATGNKWMEDHLRQLDDIAGLQQEVLGRGPCPDPPDLVSDLEPAPPTPPTPSLPPGPVFLKDLW